MSDGIYSSYLNFGLDYSIYNILNQLYSIQSKNFLLLENFVDFNLINIGQYNIDFYSVLVLNINYSFYSKKKKSVYSGSHVNNLCHKFILSINTPFFEWVSQPATLTKSTTHQVNLVFFSFWSGKFNFWIYTKWYLYNIFK